MRPSDAPLIDSRKRDELLFDLLMKIPIFLKDWREFPDELKKKDNTWKSWQEASPEERKKVLDLAEEKPDSGHVDFGMAFLKLAARMGEILIDQLNRVPEKHFLSFLNVFGIDLLPPQAALVPLTFTLTEKAPRDGFVPRGTKAADPKMGDVVFETENDLVVTRAALRHVQAQNPQSGWARNLDDLITGVGPEGIQLFEGGSAAGTRIDHRMYIGHPRLFELAATRKGTVQVKPSWKGTAIPLAWECSNENGWEPIEGSNDSFVLKGLAPKEVQGYDGQGNLKKYTHSWIRATAKGKLPGELPSLTSLTPHVTINKSNLAPDVLFFNNNKLDPIQGFFPFGERPTVNDTFYIGSQEVFSTEGAKITLKMTLSKAVNTEGTPTLTWEYWNRDKWDDLTVKPVADLTLPLGVGISFTCPPMTTTKVNGKDNYWIRVRLTSGNYGEEAQYKPKTQDDIKNLLKYLDDKTKGQVAKDIMMAGMVGYFESTLDPPFITLITLSYDFTSTPSNDFIYVTSNNGVLDGGTNKLPVVPFVRDEDTQSIFLGFDSDPAKTLQDTPVSLFCQVIQPTYTGGQKQLDAPQLPPSLLWQYWNGSSWARLFVEDGTKNFTEPGLVRFLGPTDSTPRVLFDQQLVWIKATVQGENWPQAPRLGGLFLNTVWARQGVTYSNQLLGSSNGEAHQAVSFAKAPVLEGQIIEINETILPSEPERDQAIAEEGLDAIRAVQDAAGNSTEVWVRWHPVDSFTLSGPADRQYVIDRLNGRVLFGDGVNGMLPPPGKNNIRAVVYRSGGGKHGNRPAGSVTQLKSTYPSIKSVVNHQAAAGGADQEQVDDVKVRGPHTIEIRDRVVAAEDYEWLAKQASGDIARVRCLPTTKVENGGPESKKGWITLILVPDGEDGKLSPNAGQIKSVKDYVAQRCLVTMKDRIHVIGPQYVSIAVEATVVPRRLEESQLVEGRVHENLNAFFHPIRGGQKQEGWEFGRTVYASEVATIILNTEGVDRINSLSLTAEVNKVMTTGTPNIDLLIHNALPASGTHDIQMTMEQH